MRQVLIWLVGGFLFAVLYVSALTLATSDAPVADETGDIWRLPSCPLELTLQDGSRWAKPDWSEPGCRAVIGWEVVPVEPVE